MTTQPSTVTVPMNPPSQTVMAVLTTHAIPLYKSVPMDASISSILSRNHLVDIITCNLTAGQQLIPMMKFPYKSTPQESLWEYLLSMATYIVTDFTLTFWMNAPEGVSGKLLLQVSPISSVTAFNPNLTTTKVEWDLNSGTQLQVKIAPPMSGNKRLCTATKSLPGTGVATFPARYPTNLLDFGLINLSTLTTIQPGSLFPDTYRIYVLIAFNNPQLMTIRQPRASNDEALFDYPA